MAALLSPSSSPFVGAYLGLMFLFFFISILHRGARRDASAVKGTAVERILFLLVNISFILLPFVYAMSRVLDGLDYHLPLPLGMAGLAGLVSALLLRVRAHRDLGESFTISPGTRRQRQMVTAGIYSYVRHPMYLSMLVWGISSPFVLQNYLIGPLPLVTIVVFLVVRVPLEERILVEEFGDEYRAYMSRTSALLPLRRR